MKKWYEINKKAIVNGGILFILIFFFLLLLFFSGSGKTEKEQSEADCVLLNEEQISYEEFLRYLKEDEKLNIDIRKEDVKKLIINNVKKPLDSRVFNEFPNLETLKISNCDIYNADIGSNSEKMKVLVLQNCNIEECYINSTSVHELSVESSNIETSNFDLINLKNLNLNFLDVDEKTIQKFKNSTQIQRLSLVGAKSVNLSNLAIFNSILSLRLTKAEVIDYNNLIDFNNLEEVYLDKDVNRKYIEFMEEKYKNGDVMTSSFFVKKRHNLA